MLNIINTTDDQITVEDIGTVIAASERVEPGSDYWDDVKESVDFYNLVVNQVLVLEVDGTILTVDQALLLLDKAVSTINQNTISSQVYGMKYLITESTDIVLNSFSQNFIFFNQFTIGPGSSYTLKEGSQLIITG